MCPDDHDLSAVSTQKNALSSHAYDCLMPKAQMNTTQNFPKLSDIDVLGL